MTREELFHAHLEIPRAAAGRYARRVPPRVAGPDELEAVGQAGLWDAAARYDPGSGASFETFAYRRVAGAILDFLRAFGGGRRGSSRSRGRARTLTAADIPRVSRSVWGGGAGEPPDPFGTAAMDDADPPGSAAESADMLERMFRVLPPTYSRVMRAIYTRADCETMAAAGRAVGLSQSRVSQIHQAAVRMLRERFSREGVA